MGISTSQYFLTGIDNIQRIREQLTETQTKISLGTDILHPSDDPIATSKIMSLEEELKKTDQYLMNIDLATGRNELMESVLASVNDTLNRVNELAVYANNGILSSGDLQAIAEEIRGHMDSLVALFNSRDSQGDYLFSGFQSSNTPYIETDTGGYQYVGDSGQRYIKVTADTSMAISDSGETLFEAIPASQSTIVTSASATNSSLSTASISVGSVVDQNEFDTYFPEDYVITFNDPLVNQDQLTFNVTRKSDGANVLGTDPPGYLSNVPYTSGNVIEFNGIEFYISGQPQSGDVFFIHSTTQESIVNTLDRLAIALETLSGTSSQDLSDEPVIGRSTPGRSNATLAGNYVAAQTIYVSGNDGTLQTLSINANETGANIATSLSTLTGVTATVSSTTAYLDFSDTEMFEGETISFTLNGTAITASVGSSDSTTYGNITTAITTALGGSSTLSVVNNGDGTFTFTESTGADISIEDFAVTDYPQLDFDISAGFDVGDVIAFTITGTGGETVNVSYTVADADNDEFLTELQADITAAGVAGSFTLSQTSSGDPVTLLYTGDSDGDSDIQITGFTDGGSENAQLTLTPTPGTTSVDSSTNATVTTLTNGTDVIIAATEGRATVGFRGVIGDAITLLEGAGDSSRVAAQVNISVTTDYTISSTVARRNGGLIERDFTIEDAENLFQDAIESAIGNLGKATDHILQTRSQIGVRLNSLETHTDNHQGLEIRLMTTLSDLRDIDLTEAITNLNMESLILEATQSTFVRITQLSLFNFLR